MYKTCRFQASNDSTPHDDRFLLYPSVSRITESASLDPPFSIPTIEIKMKSFYSFLLLLLLWVATTTALTVRKRISLSWRFGHFPMLLFLSWSTRILDNSSFPPPSLTCYYNHCNNNQQKKQIILKDREDRVGSLKQQLKVLERQMENHVSGKKVIAHARLSSLKKRMAHYNDQLADLSRELSEEVRSWTMDVETDDWIPSHMTRFGSSRIFSHHCRSCVVAVIIGEHRRLRLWLQTAIVIVSCSYI